jgi:hypothetical protein
MELDFTSLHKPKDTKKPKEKYKKYLDNYYSKKFLERYFSKDSDKK